MHHKFDELTGWCETLKILHNFFRNALFLRQKIPFV